MDENLLKELCARSQSGRHDMTTPFTVNGWKYATDSRIVVRVPTDGPNDAGDNRPNAEKLFERFPVEGSWREWPQALYEENYEMCSACDGDGYMDDQDPDDDCPRCDGDGQTLMPFILVDGMRISLRYDSAVRALPGPIEFAHETRSGPTAVCFRFNGGQGMVMPLYGPVQRGRHLPRPAKVTTGRIA
jgi:hypothetical protein